MENYCEKLREAVERAGLDVALRCADTIDSTNAALWRWLDEETPSDAALAGCQPERLFVADQQSGGYGRMGRAWHSPKGVNLYLSAHCPLPSVIAPASVVIAAAVSLREALARLAEKGSGRTINIELKWPNDLVVGSAKLSGLLAERRLIRTDIASFVLGVGVNVSMTDEQAPPAMAAGSWTSLALAGVDGLDRAELVATIIRHWGIALAELASDGPGPALRRWAEHDALAEQRIDVSYTDGSSQAVLSGDYLGLDDHGRLRLGLESEERCFDSAEVSVSGP